MVEPGSQGRPNPGPVVVGHDVPGGVPVAALHDEVIAEDPLEPEPETDCGVTGGRVERVALPLDPATAVEAERLLQHQMGGIRVDAGPVDIGHVPDVTPLRPARA